MTLDWYKHEEKLEFYALYLNDCKSKFHKP